MPLFEAEVRGKRSVGEIREDELTSRVFGLLELSNRDVLHDLLSRVGIDLPAETTSLLNFKFWPSINTNGVRFEPDVLLESDSTRICIEVKFGSQGSSSQLVGYWKSLKDHRNLYMLYITDALSEPPEVKEARMALSEHSPRICWTSWQDVYEILKGATPVATGFTQAILKALIPLMEALGMSFSLKDLKKLHEMLDYVRSAQNYLNKIVSEVMSVIGQNLDSDRFTKPVFAQSVLFWIGCNIYRKDKGKKIDDPYFCVNFWHEDLSWYVYLGTQKPEMRSEIKSKLLAESTPPQGRTDLPWSDVIFGELIGVPRPSEDAETMVRRVAGAASDFISRVDQSIREHYRKG